MGTGRRHESIAPSPPADLMALRLVRAEHPGPGGPLAAMSIAGGTAMSDLGPHHFPKSLCDCHTPQAIQEAGAAQLKKQHVELSVLLGERTQQVRALEADCAHAKAAHLNCAVVKRDLERAEADLYDYEKMLGKANERILGLEADLAAARSIFRELLGEGIAKVGTPEAFPGFPEDWPMVKGIRPFYWRSWLKERIKILSDVRR